MNTPWGKSDSSRQIVRGIMFYDTASHGGYHLSKLMNLRIPSYMRNENGWYEEDCEAAKVHICLSEFFPDHWFPTAMKTLKDYFPGAYEILTGETVKPEESWKRMQEMEPIIYAEKLVVRTAWGDWHEKVPKGFVGVCATLGKHGRDFSQGRYFLVPAEEYRKSRDHFVVDPTRHQEIDSLI
jgi:hypothetical protein